MMSIRMRQIEAWLYAYPIWQRQVTSLREQLDDYPRVHYEFVAVASFPKNWDSNPTYDAVEKRMTLEEERIRPLQFKIHLVENALGVLTEEEMALIRLKYFEKKLNSIVWETLFVSRRASFVSESLYSRSCMRR